MNDELAAIRERTKADREAVESGGWIGESTCVDDRETLLAAVDVVTALADRTMNAQLEYSAAYLAHDIRAAITAALDEK